MGEWRRRTSRSIVCLAAFLTALAIGAGSAAASGTVSLSGSVLSYTQADDGAGCDANVTVGNGGSGDYEFTINDCDSVITIGSNPGSACDGNGTSQVICEGDTVTQLRLVNTATAEGGEYDVDFSPDPVDFDGGAGPEDLTHGSNGLGQVDTIDGGGGADELRGGNLGDTINGGAGNDTLEGEAGTDTLNGGSEVDEIQGDADADTIDAGPGNDTNVHGDAGNDIVSGGDGNDALNGDGDDDVLNGDANNDTLSNSPGADTFNGGAGTDTANYNVDASTAAITADIDGAAGDDGPGCPGVSCEGDTVAIDVENLTGNNGSDVLIGHSGDAAASVLDGQEGADTLRGSTATGNDGADTFIGGAGAADEVSYSLRTDEIVASIEGGTDGAASEGDSVGSGVEILTGGSGDDDLTGNALGNVLNGGPGDDDLQGDTGITDDEPDQISGGTDGTTAAPNSNGDDGDTASYAHRNSVVNLSIDGVANDGSDGCPLGPNCEDDIVGADIENLAGGTGQDTLTGSNGDNRIEGGVGSDTLRGGPGPGPDGADTLVGGAGAGDLASFANRTDDVEAVILPVDFPDVEDVVDSSTENLTGGSGNDNLLGFTNANVIDGGPGDDFLKGALSPVGADGSDTFIGGTNGAAGDTVGYQGRTGPVTADLDGAASDDGAPGEQDTIQNTVENLTGGFDEDTLTGNAGANRIEGGDGIDTLLALGGADRIEARDGFNDAIDCGDEGDIAILDPLPLDDPLLGCETLNRNVDPPLPPGGTPPGGNPGPGPGAGAQKCKKAKKGKKKKKKKCKKKKRKKR
jgi:Ca2+-binding RTX toxin-like protein